MQETPVSLGGMGGSLPRRVSAGIRFPLIFNLWQDSPPISNEWPELNSTGAFKLIIVVVIRVVFPVLIRRRVLQLVLVIGVLNSCRDSPGKWKPPKQSLEKRRHKKANETKKNKKKEIRFVPYQIEKPPHKSALPEYSGSHTL